MHPPPSSSEGRQAIAVIVGTLGEHAVSQLRRNFPNASIILLTTDHHGPGGQAVLPHQITSALEAWAGPAKTLHLTPILTPRQQDILELIAQGKSNKQIARDLSISPFTVRNHVSLLLRVLNVATREDAAAKVAESSVNCSI